MLQQILNDMYIDPDVLDALNEDQKKTLFLKMRQEQVRRWKEREEKMEKEEPHKPKPKTAHSKSVSWLLGRDGDVQVIIIGEMDEFKSSKILYTGLGERKAASLLNNSCNQAGSLKSNLVNRTSTEPVRCGRENLPPKTLSGVQVNLKENSEEVRTLPPPQVPACEQKPASPVESVRKAEEDAEEDDSAPLSSICYRPHFRAIPKTASILHSLGPQDMQEKTSLSIASRLRPHEPPEPHTNRGRWSLSRVSVATTQHGETIRGGRPTQCEERTLTQEPQGKISGWWLHPNELCPWKWTQWEGTAVWVVGV
uniref:SH2 domain containing 4A n=1 Tax=Pygocentrus nattereri TaxID=42514 RepID=A0AAR2JBJ2_PYGNA